MKLRLCRGAPLFAAALAVLLALLLFPARYAARVQEGISLWAVCVLPVMLPFLFLTLLLSRLPQFDRISRALSPAFSRAFRVSGAGGCAAVLSVFSGYPAGARAVLGLSARGCIAKEERLRAACLATTSGPAFLLGTLAAIAGSGAGIVLFIAHLAGVWSVSFLLGRRAPRPQPAPLPPPQAEENALTESLMQAVLSVLAVGGAIALFYAFGCMIADLLRPLALPPRAAATVQGLIEMTSGCAQLLAVPSPINLALSAFLVTFGGMCVLVQQWSFLKGTGIRLAPFLLVKAAQAAVSAAATFLLALPLF